VDPIQNPFEPGAGTPPPALVGRDPVLEDARVSIGRLAEGRTARNLVLVGLRGVGKTVLLDEIRRRAAADSIQAIRIEAPEGRSLPGMIAPRMREALLRLSRLKRGKALAERGLRALAGFVSALKLKYDDIEIGLDFEPEAGLADNGDLEADLSTLMQTAGEAAQAAGVAVVLFIDELQYVIESELAALITALHRCAQEQLPVLLMGAGLPQLPGQMGKAKSYSERLFRFCEIGALEEEAARAAIEVPLAAHKVTIQPAALRAIVKKTEGYPYFLQEWGKHAWDEADRSPIRKKDVEVATVLAEAALDSSFFRVRLDRLTPSEKRYLRAMATLGPGPHRSGDIADVLQRRVQSLGPVRSQLIAKGMAYSPSHGDTAFTVPLFDAYMRRVIPRLEDLS
jgi:hypothetical protein